LNALSMRINFFGKRTDFCALIVVDFGERKRRKATALYVDGVIALSKSRSLR